MLRRVLVTLVVALAACPAAAHADGLRIVASQQLTPRLWDYTTESSALAAPVHARVLLPDGYAAHPKKRYPVLWLLHGGYDHVPSWTEKGAAEAITAGLDLIVVMPEDGNGGWYADWYNGGRGGAPAWETYDIEQLLPWVDQTFRTIADRGHRAVVGLSTGGYGTMHLAARHPDLFSFAASYSGALDVVGNAAVAVVIGGEAMADGGEPDDVFGNRLTYEIGWRAGNPTDLADNLRGLELEVRTGNGQAGEYDSGLPFDPIEYEVHEMSVTFHKRLQQLGIAHLWDDYGPGTHSWPYWQRDLRRTLPRMLASFARPPAAPSPFTFVSYDRAYRVYGFEVALKRAAYHALTTLAKADSNGFELTSGAPATVLTPARYAPRGRYRVRVGDREQTLSPGADRRFAIDVPSGTRVAVRIARVKRRVKTRRGM